MAISSCNRSRDRHSSCASYNTFYLQYLFQRRSVAWVGPFSESKKASSLDSFKNSILLEVPLKINCRQRATTTTTLPKCTKMKKIIRRNETKGKGIDL